MENKQLRQRLNDENKVRAFSTRSNDVCDNEILSRIKIEIIRADILWIKGSLVLKD